MPPASKKMNTATSIEWKDLVGRRVLMHRADDVHKIREYAVCEVSSSGARVKMRNAANNTFWCDAAEYVFEEDLGPI